ncbi:HRDC domain-containing protein [Clostridium tagluense]|uniref:HRDC domain-containing protein n=1 Tax=Clostridium tagluense TaxID=360422 RepID=UPI001C6E141E|nr:HRDC domain-containing protein [Clostridium tagluense]MBW9158794.1 NERD domain-containing protein [Clostridium tagluense]WLC67411.1 NERD domain-containing protein [Clostridium tagluense]
MGFLSDIFDARKIKGPVFYKEFSEDNKQLEDLEELFEKVKSKKKNLIKKDIILLKVGLDGEKNVNYELKNSFIPMICLHDIRISHEDNIAQLDYVLVTEYFTMVIETKKLTGDIVINEAGEFTRKFKNNYGKVIKEEGMYSPISQNSRHVRILEDMLKKNGLIKIRPVYSMVVIANPKSIINRTKAPADIKNNIIKHDRITDMLNKKIKKVIPSEKMRESQMMDIANFLKNNHTEITYDYYKKYGLTDEDFKEDINSKVDEVIEESYVKVVEIKSEQPVEKIAEIEIVKPIERIEDCIEKNYDQLYEKLKKYRYAKSQEEALKAYCIFSNNTLEEIIKVKPTSKEELLKVQGFGKVKVEKYGADIIGIIRE